MEQAVVDEAKKQVDAAKEEYRRVSLGWGPLSTQAVEAAQVLAERRRDLDATIRAQRAKAK